MAPKPDSGTLIKKPTQLASKLIEVLGFKNPEDLMYKLAQGYIQYMNYGMFPAKDSPDYGEYPEEAINYFELFGLYRDKLEKNLDIMEIGCGFGYGAQLIYEEFKPNSLLSIDRAENAILYAKKNQDNTNVEYKYDGFSDEVVSENSLDVIYTVETGGRFPMLQSFELVHKFLKKGGVFLVANINPENEIAKKREFAKKAGFELYKEKDVTQQVIDYLKSEQKTQRFYSAIDKMPFHKSIIWKLFMKNIKELARMPGSKSHDLLGTQEFYYHFCFKKV